MSGLWIAVLAASLVVAAALAWPLLRRRGPSAPQRRDYDVAVWRDQLAEIDRDLERHLIDEAEAEAARVEVKRRILAGATESDPSDAQSAKTGRSPVVATVVAAAVPVLALIGYLSIGAPGIPDQPLAARIPETEPGEPAVDPAMAAAIAGLRARLESDPDDQTGWLLLGRTYRAMQRYDQAVPAFRRALELSGGAPAVAVDYGEAIVGAAGGRVGADARQVFQAALAADPVSPKARYYLALAEAQNGNLAGALQGWVDLLALSPPDAPWLAIVREQIRQAAAELGIDPATVQQSADLPEATPPPILTREQMDAVANMTEEDRAAFIRSMVERLAARLEDTPEDRSGWLRLARAWEVLGEPEKAAEARAKAADLAPAAR